MTDRLNFEVMSEAQAGQLSGQVLAYMGDAVHTMLIREYLICRHSGKSGDLHKLSTKLLSAVAQSEHVLKLMDSFSERELDIFKRGRNAKVHSVAKHASVAEYKMATGYEAVIGYLYLSGNMERIKEILNTDEREEEGKLKL